MMNIKRNKLLVFEGFYFHKITLIFSFLHLKFSGGWFYGLLKLKKNNLYFVLLGIYLFYYV